MSDPGGGEQSSPEPSGPGPSGPDPSGPLDLEQAVAALREQAQGDESSAELLYNLGSIERRLGRPRQAVAALRRAAALDPDDAAIFNNLGLAWQSHGLPERAVEAYREASRLDPQLTAARINLGNALRDLGRRQEAAASYRRAIELHPASAVAYFNMHAALYDEDEPGPAEHALSEALSLRPAHEPTRFYLAALQAWRERSAELPDDVQVPSFLRDSYAFAAGQRQASTRMFADTLATIEHAQRCAPAEGLTVELGVRFGTSLRMLARGRTGPLHGFDSFEGLPEAWGQHPAGVYSTDGELPDALPAGVKLHRGWFAETLPAFVAEQHEPVRLLHVDCDLYSSTETALRCLVPLIGGGTIVLFDEYLCNPDWQQEEHRALREVARDCGWTCRYVAFSLFTKQAVVQIVDAPRAAAQR